MNKEQEMYMQMQVLEQEMNQLQEQMQEFEQRVKNAQNVKKSLDEFKKVNEGDEILVPINNGVFAKARMLDSKNLKVNVGGGIVANKSVEDTQRIVEKQIIELKKMQEKLQNTFNESVKKAEKLAESLQ